MKLQKRYSLKKSILTRMSRSEFTYSENVLQWVWKTLHFDTSSLSTATGKECEIRVIDPGELNTTDGPDFKNAVIEIDGVKWHGSVEMHIGSKSWYSHGHHHDKNFNSVVLHVVVEEDPVQVSCEDGNKPFTLNLLPHFNKEVGDLFRAMNNSSGLPCANGLTYISEKALSQQIEKAQFEYLEKKVNDFIEFFDPALLPFNAWKSALILSLFDGFGISKNREQMVKVGEKFLEMYGECNKGFPIQALHEFSQTLNWNYRGVRPHNRPEIRVVESIAIGRAVMELPEEQFLEQSTTDLWKAILKKSSISESGRTRILFGTVFIPAMYTLGNLLAYEKLKYSAFQEWKYLSVPVPDELLERYAKVPGLSPEIYSGKLGAVHQLRSYCSKRRCHECFVLKKVISS